MLVTHHCWRAHIGLTLVHYTKVSTVEVLLALQLRTNAFFLKSGANDGPTYACLL